VALQILKAAVAIDHRKVVFSLCRVARMSACFLREPESMDKRATQPPELPRIAFSADDIAAMTGVCQTVIRKLMYSRQLPSAKLGRRRVVLKDDLDAFLASCRTA
jgi:excisionase family DNA binding protein